MTSTNLLINWRWNNLMKNSLAGCYRRQLEPTLSSAVQPGIIIDSSIQLTTAQMELIKKCFSRNRIAMAARLSKSFLAYFYHSSAGFGLVFVSCDFERQTVNKSNIKIVYAILWGLFFVRNFFKVSREVYQGYDASFNNSNTSSYTALLELCVTFVVTLLFIFIQSMNIGSTILYARQLFRIVGVDGFSYNIDHQIILMAIFGELTFIYIFVFTLFVSNKSGIEKLFVFNPLDNSIVKTFLITSNILVISRFSIFLSLSIDICKKFVANINQRIDKALTLARAACNPPGLVVEIGRINQLYDEILFALKLFEQNYGKIILIIQCFVLMIGINQVRSLQKP